MKDVLKKLDHLSTAELQAAVVQINALALESEPDAVGIFFSSLISLVDQLRMEFVYDEAGIDGFARMTSSIVTDRIVIPSCQ